MRMQAADYTVLIVAYEYFLDGCKKPARISNHSFARLQLCPVLQTTAHGSALAGLNWPRKAEICSNREVA